MRTHREALVSVITAIVASPRKAGRFDLLADGRYEATLSIEAIERLGLVVGREYDALRQQVEREAVVLATYDRALNLLALRARSSRELRRYLVRKGESPDHVDAAIARLQAAGFLDDAAFARQFARSKAVGAGMSRRRIQQELGRRGISREVSDGAITDAFEEEQLDEATLVEQAARKKLRALTQLDADTRKRRLFAFLARRGYDLDDIKRVIQAVVAEEIDVVE